MAAVERVPDDAEGLLREQLLEPRREALERPVLAVLLLLLGVVGLHGLREERDSHPHGVMIRASRAYLRFSLSASPVPRLRSQSVPSTATQRQPQSVASLNHLDRMR